MSETPAPFWVGPVVEPYYDTERAAWIAAVRWRESLTGHEVRAESEERFETYEHALEASRSLAASPGLFDGLVAASPPDMGKAERGGFGLPASGDDRGDQPPARPPERIGLTEWLRRQESGRRDP